MFVSNGLPNLIEPSMSVLVPYATFELPDASKTASRGPKEKPAMPPMAPGSTELAPQHARSVFLL